MTRANAKPLNIVKRDDLVPLCSHCSRELTEVYSKSKGVPFIQGTNILYFCPHCRKVLGFGQSRMI
jgi:uncharacterized protein with PIN domain